MLCYRCMPAKSAIKSVSLRLEGSVYRRASELAEKRNVSLNNVLTQALLLFLEQEEQERLFDGFTQLGDEAEVEFARAAQAEVSLGHES